MGKAFEMMLSEHWAIQPEMLDTMQAIALRMNESPEALAAKLGRPLENSQRAEIRGSVAVLPVHGPIFRRANLFTEISGATSIDVSALDLTAAEEDPAVSHIVFDFSTPGGQAAGISEYAARIRACSKPTIAYVGDQAASAGYWLASACDEIVISDTAILGSIGVVVGFDTKSKEQGKVISSQSPLKQADPNTSEGRAEVQRVVDDLATVFINAVANYRNTDPETVMADFGKGGVLVGEKAVAAGMADRIGSFESVIAGLSGTNHPMEGFTMTEKTVKPEITRSYLAANHPDIVAEIQEEARTEAYDAGRAEGIEAGATRERERIQAVEAQSMAGHEDLIASLKYDGKTTGEQAAVAVLSAEKKARATHGEQIADETPKPVATVSEEEQVAANLPLKDRCQAEWDKTPALRDEFGEFETYYAYAKANESGLAKTMGGKS